jgi:hypothetical protein
VVGDEIHNETHAETREQGIYYIAYGSTYACYETISASFVQGSLNTEHANWSHWGRYYNADEYALQQQLKDIYLVEWERQFILNL